MKQALTFHLHTATSVIPFDHHAILSKHLDQVLPAVPRCDMRRFSGLPICGNYRGHWLEGFWLACAPLLARAMDEVTGGDGCVQC